MNALRTLTMLAFLVSALAGEVICQQPTAAVVEKISGTVLLKQKGKQMQLDAKTDLARRLYAGDSVYCEKGGKLSLWLGGRPTELDENSGWFTISRPASPQADPKQKALDAYGRTGGRSRGKIRLLYSPSDESVVMPGMFVIRWIPPEKRCPLSLAIEKPGGKELWRQEIPKSASGVLDSGAAKEALLAYRSRVGEGTLFLKLSDSCGNEDRVTFAVLSLADERSLTAELAGWKNEPSKLIAHLGRAAVFVDYQMFPQAAEEYEAALARAPESRDLLLRTILAHRRTSNHARAEQLEKRLPPGTEP